MSIFTIDPDRGTSRRRVQFCCPLDGREVDCVLEDDSESGRLVEVARCSRFAPADHLRCEQQCVELMNAGFTLDSDGDG